jgi:hypothetical protein
MTKVIQNYEKESANSVYQQIQKGQLNKVRLRSQVINEHAESSRLAHTTVESGVKVGQIFKASQDNINGINLTLESAAAVVLDNFESYADDAEPNGNSSFSIFIEDENMGISDNMISNTKSQLEVTRQPPQPLFLPKGSKYEIYFNDDFSDSVTHISAAIFYSHIPNVVNG